MSMIKSDAVKRLFLTNGFRYSFGIGGSKFTYVGNPNGSGKATIPMEFAAPWLSTDPLMEYDLGAVRKMMTSMIESAKSEYMVYQYLQDPTHVKQINDAMNEFGMVYSGEDNQFYYVKDGSAVFGVDYDYIAAMICTGKTTIDKLVETLGDMLETAEYEAKESKRARKLEDGSKV